jgi:fatty acid desaturase
VRVGSPIISLNASALAVEDSSTARADDRSTAPAAQPGRPRYTSSYSALLRQVQAAGLMERRRRYYWLRGSALVLAFVAVWIAFGFLGNSWFQLIPAAVLAVVVTQIGFFAHDGAHQQIFATRKWNEWTSRMLAGAFAGLSYGWWNTKHNRHHGAPNQETKDPDIAPGIVAFTPAVAAAKAGGARWLTARQGWFFFPLLLLEGLNLHVASVRSLLDGGAAKHRRIELALIVLRLGGVAAVVLLLLPIGKAGAFLGVQLGLFGLLLGGAFAPNHTGMPIVARDEKLDFVSRQVLMSRNISGGVLIDFAMGGLNHQIEHHLFPSMPRPNLRKAAPLVRRHCALNGITYTQTTFGGSLKIIVSYLSRMGLFARDPFSCPLAASLRA